MTAGVVLAAGASTRLGRPKQTVMMGGETLVERAARVALKAGLRPVFVVLRAGDAAAMEQASRIAGGGAEVVWNAEAEEGMAASIRCGVRAAEGHGAAGVVLMTCDQVAMTAAHLQALCAEPEAAAGSGYAGKVGIPAYFPRASFDGLRALRGDVGARGMLAGARAVETEALALDVDTEEDVERARRWVER